MTTIRTVLLLNLVLILLKLTGAITWSWWIVMAPALVIAALALLLIAVVAVILALIPDTAKQSDWEVLEG